MSLELLLWRIRGKIELAFWWNRIGHYWLAEKIKKVIQTTQVVTVPLPPNLYTSISEMNLMKSLYKSNSREFKLQNSIKPYDVTGWNILFSKLNSIGLIFISIEINPSTRIPSLMNKTILLAHWMHNATRSSSHAFRVSCNLDVEFLFHEIKQWIYCCLWQNIHLSLYAARISFETNSHQIMNIIFFQKQIAIWKIFIFKLFFLLLNKSLLEP